MVARTKTKKTTETVETVKTPTPSTPEEIKAALGSWSRAIRFLATHPDFSNPSTNKPNYSKIGKRLNKRPQHVRNVLLNTRSGQRRCPTPPPSTPASSRSDNTPNQTEGNNAP